MSIPNISAGREQEIRDQLERSMEEGRQPYVVYKGRRWAFSEEVLKSAHVTSGVEVFRDLLIALIAQEVESWPGVLAEAKKPTY